MVRASPTALERALLRLDERIDALGAMPEFDIRPTVRQDQEIARRLGRLEALISQELPSRQGSGARKLLATARSHWANAMTSARPPEWAGSADAALETLAELSAAVGLASGRPSVLAGTAADVEKILLRAISRERRRPGQEEFYYLVRMNVAGLPTAAFGLAAEAVGAALVERGFDEEDEPPAELRLPIMERAIEIARTRGRGPAFT
jgi:hypothetical protein